MDMQITVGATGTQAVRTGKTLESQRYKAMFREVLSDAPVSLYLRGVVDEKTQEPLPTSLWTENAVHVEWNAAWAGFILGDTPYRTDTLEDRRALQKALDARAEAAALVATAEAAYRKAKEEMVAASDSDEDKERKMATMKAAERALSTAWSGLAVREQRLFDGMTFIQPPQMS